MGKFYNIDPNTCSMEELGVAIKACRSAEGYFYNMEQSCKRFINSQYGALANQFYNCANVDIAESITLQGQDLIKYSVRVVNAYFTDIWPIATASHAEIAKRMKEKFPEFNEADFLTRARAPFQFGTTLQIYGDTDSAYISLQPLIDACNIPENMHTDFVLAVNDVVLAGYLESKFDEYAKMFNCKKNLEKFELEKIARTVIMLAKKKYIMDLSWKEPDIHIQPLHKIVYKGIEVIQGAFPNFCRSCMKDFIKYVLEYVDKGDLPSYEGMVRKLKEIKAKFTMASPNDISKSFTMKDYDKYIKRDIDCIEYQKDPNTGKNVVVPIHVRAAAIYNYTLNSKASAFKTKYNTIKRGDKVKFYYTTEKDAKGDPGVFGFINGEFPVEFAPKMDLDEQFKLMIMNPLNRIIVAAGFDEIPYTLTYSAGLW